MTLKNDRYTYRVTWSEDDNEYVGGALRGVSELKLARSYSRGCFEGHSESCCRYCCGHGG